MVDHQIRSLAKTVTYRGSNMVVSFTLFTLVTGSYKIGGLLMLADATISSLLFYYHERLWDKIGWKRSE